MVQNETSYRSHEVVTAYLSQIRAMGVLHLYTRAANAFRHYFRSGEQIVLSSCFEAG